MSTNLQATDKVLDAMRDAGHIEDVDAADVEALRTLAMVVDSPEGFADAALWRQYRAAIETVRGLSRSDDDNLSTLLAEMGDAAKTGT